MDSSRLKLPALWLALLFMCTAACAQKPAPALPSVTISAKANRDPVEKSYRKMIRGMDLFERKHTMAPNAELRYRLLPRKADTSLENIEMEVVGTKTSFPVTIAPDHTFTLERNRRAFDEDAQVTPNRKQKSMTWRTDIRTPGLPPNARRLGDLRLECEVGMEAGLISNANTLVGRIANAISDTLGFCNRKEARYLFFANRPIFSVDLVAGNRRETLAIDKLYASVSDDAGLLEDLTYCDCEVLLDRTYFLPLGDRSWPDDTLVEFEYMDDGP